MQRTVYLSGKMAGRPTGEVLDERKHASELCSKWGLAVLDPAKDEGLDALRPDEPISFRYTEKQMASFIAKDEADVLRSQILLVLTGDTPSDGTWWEMSLAKQFNIPIILVAPKRARGEMMGFTNLKVHRIFETVEAAVVYMALAYTEPVKQMEVV